jgi:hypothetical protein
MVNWKLDRIKNINDEVNELHPLLKDLFRAIPDIRQVQYTQGNRENGADFVLTKTDRGICWCDRQISGNTAKP